MRNVVYMQKSDAWKSPNTNGQVISIKCQVMFKNVFNEPVLFKHACTNHTDCILGACMVMSGVSALFDTVKINKIELVKSSFQEIFLNISNKQTMQGGSK